MNADSTTQTTDGQGDETESAGNDPRQLILPHVDTSIDVGDGRFMFKIPLPAAMVAFPAAIAIMAGIWFLISSSPVLGAILLVVGIAGGMGAVMASAASGWSMYPHERVLAGVHHARRRLSMPWGYSTALDKAGSLHGISRCITVELGDERETETFAGVLTHDERAVIPIRLCGENSEMLEPGDLESMAASLTQGIDGETSEGGEAIAFYSTTRPAASRAADEYDERARNFARNRLSGLQSGLLGDIGEWVADRDAETGANEVEHYLMVTVSEHASRGRSRVGEIEHRLEEAMNAIGRSNYLDSEPVTPREAANLACEYWDRGTFPAGDVGESAADAAFRPVDIDEVGRRSGTTGIERFVTPEWYDEKTRHVEVGDAVARTYWIADWPEQPSARFLRDLYTMRGVDLDIKLYGHPKSREETMSNLKRQIPRIDSEGMDSAESMDVRTLTIDDDLDAYVLAYQLLQSVNVRPWGLSGYVTVRAPDTEKLQQACERVEKDMRQPPARMTPSATFGEQHRTFRSAAPFGDDHYAGLGNSYHRATKTHLALGGVFGAALPAASASLSEAGGIRWGRDTTTGRTIQVDPFEQGTAPHLITLAPSGSGKTFSVKQASQEWWLNGDDRTLVYCDTQGGFEDTVEAFDAEHIVIDGQTGINPLDIRPAAEHDQAGTKGEHNQYRLTVDSATDFFCGIIRGNGVDPADYRAKIEQAIEQTYANHGITADPETHTKPSPEPSDLFETFGDMMRNPDEYTHTGDAGEAEGVKDRIKDLLNELSGFQEGGKYHHMLEATADGISPDTEMAYIDMRQLAGQASGAKSVNLQLAVGQVSQLIKQTDGETIFVIDEAHNLLHSPEMVDWLNKAAREWRRYDAALWFVTQSPQEFVRRATGTESGAENKRESIVEQCSTVQLLNCYNVDVDTLAQFGFPRSHANIVKHELVAGNSDMDFSECVLSFRDERGWIRTEIRANPLHEQSITFTHRSGWSYKERMLHALGADVDAPGETYDTAENLSVDSDPGPDSAPSPQPANFAADGGEEGDD